VFYISAFESACVHSIQQVLQAFPKHTHTHTVKPKCTAINVKRVENIRRRCIEACDDLDFAEIPARIEGDGIWRFDVDHILFVNESRRKRGELQAD
jgi:hypothetical protein